MEQIDVLKIRKELPREKLETALILYGDFLYDIYTELDWRELPTNMEPIGEGNHLKKFFGAIEQLRDQTKNYPDHFVSIEVEEYKRLIQEMVNPFRVSQRRIYLNEVVARRVPIDDIPFNIKAIRRISKIVTNETRKPKVWDAQKSPRFLTNETKTCSCCGAEKNIKDGFNFSPHNPNEFYRTKKCTECLNEEKKVRDLAKQRLEAKRA